MRKLTDPKYIDGDFVTGVSAAGTTQSDATTLAANHVKVGTVAAGAGVVVKALPVGEVFSVANAGANTLLVYPPSGSAFNGQTTNAAVSLPAGGGLFGRIITSTDITVVF